MWICNINYHPCCIRKRFETVEYPWTLLSDALYKLVHPVTSNSIRNDMIIISTILLGTFSQLAHSYGVQYMKASQTTIMKSADIVINFTAQAFGTHDSIAVTSLSGAVLIIMSIFLAFTNVENDLIPRYLAIVSRQAYQPISKPINEQTRLIQPNQIGYTT